MTDRKLLLQVLLYVALVLILVVPVSAAGTSATVPLPDDQPANYLTADSTSPVSAMALNTSEGEVIPMIAAGNDRIVGLKSDGTLVAVGLYSFICGVGSGGSLELQYGGHSSPLYVSDWTDIIQVAAGHARTVCLKADGTVVTVGIEANEHLYSGFESWTDILQVAEGDHHIVGLKADGTVVAVGDNDYGQCDVGGWTNIVQIAAGEYHTVGLRADSTVVAVGWNEYGQCDVRDWRDIVQVATGGDHTVGLKSDGTVVAAGYNCHGQCHVGDWTDIIQVASRYIHTVGLKSDGTVVAAGEEKTWVCNVSTWTDVVQVAAGSSSTIGLKTDGTVVATGSELDYHFQPVESAALARVAEWNLGVTRYDLTISSTAGGSVAAPGEGIYIYTPRRAVNLVAEPEDGYRFVRWAGDVSTVRNVSATSTTITVHGDYSITANFEKTHVVEWALIGVLIALVIAALVIFFVRKKRLARMGLENKIWGFLRRPATTFREVKEETLGGVLKYALIGLLFFGVLMGIMLALLTSGGLFDLVRDWLPGFGWIPDNPLLLIAEVVGFSVAGGMLLIFIGGAWMHIWVHIFGGRRGHTYKQTIKALVYGATPMYVIGWLPFVGGVIGSIWAIVLIIVALRELHGISTGRAAGAALLAIGIAGAVVMLLAVVLLAAFLGPFVYLFIWWLALFLLMGG